MKKLWIAGFILTLGLGIAQVAPVSGQPPHRFSTNERAIGTTTGDWAFMSVWNLSTGQLEVSPAWRDGTHTWTYGRSGYGQWMARFIYQQATGQTRELQWSYTQSHVQYPPSEPSEISGEFVVIHAWQYNFPPPPALPTRTDLYSPALIDGGGISSIFRRLWKGS